MLITFQRPMTMCHGTTKAKTVLRANSHIHWQTSQYGWGLTFMLRSNVRDQVAIQAYVF
jgi:hypothetical protein